MAKLLSPEFRCRDERNGSKDPAGHPASGAGRVGGPESYTKSMSLPIVWIIGADHWPRAMTRAELIERGVEAVGFVEARDAAIELMRTRSQRPSLVVIDVRNQVIDERWLAPFVDAGVPLVAVAGATEASEVTSQRIPWRAVLRLPITIGQIADAIEREA
jgi:hypothetical protein